MFLLDTLYLVVYVLSHVFIGYPVSFCLSSVSKTMRELRLEWSTEPVQLSPEVKMPQFLVESVLAETCDESAVLGKDYYLHYSGLTLEKSLFIITRISGPYGSLKIQHCL